MTPTLRLDAKCPSCGAPPAIRITIEERSFSLLLDPAVVRQSYRCSGTRTRPCGTIYLLPAAWLADGELWCHEVKGGHIWTSAKIRFKAHATARPWIRWTMVQRVKGGGWRTLHDRRPEAGG